MKRNMRLQFSNEKKKWHRGGVTLQYRLVLYIVLLAVFLILFLVSLLALFGINGKDEKAVNSYFDTELSHISEAVYDDFGRLSVSGISIADTISDSCDNFFLHNQITAADLRSRPELIEPLLAEQIQTLKSTITSYSCGGAYILLDATVQPEGETAEYSRAGIFLKKMQPTSTQIIGIKYHYLRGPAQIARDNGIELLGQWQMEYNIKDESFFTKVMETARQYPELPVSRLYYWSGRVTLKNNSEAGFLLCVPLRSSDGTVFGLCGIEVSDRMFKQLYCPSDTLYTNVFSVAAPSSSDTLLTSSGIIAGNYYLTGNRMNEDLGYTLKNNGFVEFTGEQTYAGKQTSLRLYPSGSPYEDNTWSVAVMMPENLLKAALQGNSAYLFLIICIFLIISPIAAIITSRRYLHPVTKALEAIRQQDYETVHSKAYLEIADLFDFLAEKDKEHEEERRRLEERNQTSAAEAESALTELSRIAERKRQEIDPDAYALFCSNLGTLTPKEREIFRLYLDGKTAKDITGTLNINENTLKYHNRNIYGKLGVSSRKELLMYAVLRNQERNTVT